MEIRINRSSYITLLCACLLIMGSCKVLRPVRLPPPIQPPATFGQVADSSSIGDIPWNEFFADSNLVRLIDAALQHNMDLQMAIQRVEIANAQVRLRRGALLPSLNVVASAGVDKFGEYTLNGVGNYDTNLSDKIDNDRRIPTPTPDYFVGLRSAWEMDIWGKLRNQRKAAYARYLASDKGRQLVQTALIAQVAGLYYNLLALDNELNIIRRNIELQQTAVEMVTIQKQGGRANELAVQQLTAQLLRTRSMEAQIQQQIVDAENTLNFLLGRFPQTITRGTSLLEQELPQEINAGVPARMLLRRPDIQQAELELLAAKADVDAARAAFLPSIVISPYVGFNAFKASLLFSSPASLAYGVVGSLTAPLFNNNLLRANMRQSAAGNREAFYGYQRAVLTGYQEVMTSLKGIENYGRVYQLKAQEAEVLRNAVTTSNDMFAAGFANYLEVVTAQQSALEAELGLTNAKKEQFLFLIDLYRALGGGWR